MPEKYLQERNKLVGKGMPLAKAKTKAARDYNRNRPKGVKPILSTSKYEAKVKDKKPGRG
jgi:hypothetical protein